MMPPVATALAALMAMPAIPLTPHATPIDDLTRLRAALGGKKAPRLLMKRDDLLSFGGGGNKIRKLQTVIAEAKAGGADMLITCGGLQSNHARATAAAGAALGLPVVLVLNGEPPANPLANTRLDLLFGADVRYVPNREARVPTMQAVADELRRTGRRPAIVPIGASTPTGAMGFARGLAEILGAGIKPDIIVHSSSSGGTQAGVVAGCRLFGMSTKIIGVSADERADDLQAIVRNLINEMAARLGVRPETLGCDDIDVDDTQVGQGYGIPTAASSEALELLARKEGILLDPTYTAKAMAGLIARVRHEVFDKESTVLFWHTGGQIGLFT